MTRSSTTSDTGTALADPAGIDQPLERLRPGGSRLPLGIAVAIVSILGTLIWQPWGRADSPIVPSSGLRTTAAAVAQGAASATPMPSPSLSPSSSPFPSLRPLPTLGPSGSGTPGRAAYVSLVDNEWTVVALLAPNALAPARAPLISDGTGLFLASGAALLVLQQGLNYSIKPLERPGTPDVACDAPGPPRYRTAVQLPADRVAYVGVTFPGMNRRARVTATILDDPGGALRRLASLAVPLSGMTEGFRYTVPNSGPGGAVLFAMVPPRILPIATLRFDIESPGTIGHRYLYACIRL